MIAYWHNTVDVVRLQSVCLSVCDAVHCGSHSRCTGLKVVPACSYSNSMDPNPIRPFRHLCRRMYRLARKRSAKKRVEENASMSFFMTTRVLVYNNYLLLTCCGLIRRHSLRLGGFSECVHK